MHGETTDVSRRRNRCRLLLLIGFPLLLLIGCALPEEPGDWSWDTHIYVPLGARTYGMWELADPLYALQARGSGIGMLADSSLHFNDDSSMFFLGYEELAVSFRDSLYVDPATYTVLQPIASLLVPDVLEWSTFFSLGELNPEVAALHGTIQDLPPHPVSASYNIHLTDLVDSMVVDTGTVTVTIISTLTYEVNDISVVLDNSAGDEYVLATGLICAPQGAIVQRVPLAGMSLLQTMVLRLTGTGAGGNGIQVDSTRGLAIDPDIDTVRARSYHGIIPPQVVHSDSSAAFQSRHRLYVGEIDTGLVTITVYNESQLDETVWIVFPTLMTQSGDTLTSMQIVPAGESRSEIVDLRHYIMRIENETPQRVPIQMQSLSAQTDTRRHFTPFTEYIRGEIVTTAIGFDYFRGELGDLTLNFPVEGRSIGHMPQGWEAVHPVSVDALLSVRGGPGLNATANTSVNIQTYLTGNPLASANLSSNQVYLGIDTTLQYPGMTNLFTQYPDSLSAAGMITVSGPVEIRETESVDIAVELRAPLEFVLSEVNAPGDIHRVDSEDIQDILGGTARVRVWNHLPAGGRVYLVADPDSMDVLWNSGADVDTVADMPIPVGPVVNRRATTEAYTEMTFPLREETLELFRHLPFYTRFHIHMPGSDGDTLIALGSDYIRAQVIADLIYRIDTGD